MLIQISAKKKRAGQQDRRAYTVISNAIFLTPEHPKLCVFLTIVSLFEDHSGSDTFTLAQIYLCASKFKLLIKTYFKKGIKR